jgi:hypothetical protein
MRKWLIRALGKIFIVGNGWRYGVGLPCRLFQPTTTVNGKLHYTACYQPADFNAECLIETLKKKKKGGENSFKEYPKFNT